MNEIIMLKEERDIVKARHAGREIAKKLGFTVADQTRLATAISEITRNAIQYAGGGICTINGEANQFEKLINVVVEDRGPGIKDINRAMEDGFSTSKGLGAGLPGSKRLMHNFHIASHPGEGTTVVMTMTRKII